MSKLVGGLALVDQAVDRGLEAGEPRFPVCLKVDDFPILASLGKVMELATNRLRERELIILQVNAQELSGTAILQVEVPQPPIGDSPASRADEFQKRLRPFTAPSLFGCPFGPSQGLEAVVAIALRTLPDSGERRERCQVADSVLTHYLQSGRLKFDDLDRALGLRSASTVAYGLPEDRLQVLWEDAVSAKSVLADREEAVAEWNTNETLATQCLAYFSVASDRLNSANQIH